MLIGLLVKAAMFPINGIPILTCGGASFGLRRNADINARNTQAISAPPARSAVCGISRIVSIGSKRYPHHCSNQLGCSQARVLFFCFEAKNGVPGRCQEIFT